MRSTPPARRAEALAWLALAWLLAPCSGLAQDPAAVLETHGCTACHSLDGSASVGPSLLRLFERTSEVTSGGATRRVSVDDAYVRRAIREPDADLVEGFTAGSMPALALSSDELDAITAALHALRTEPETRTRTLWILAPSALLFLFLHLGLSSHPIRARLVARLGAKAFAGIYSLLILITLAGMIVGWMMRPYVALWDPPHALRFVPLVAMPIAYFLLIAGFTVPSPTIAGMEERASLEPKGISTVTRHPALWGFALWGLSHLAVNGDLASLFLFGSVAALALLGMLHIDRRRAREMGERWRTFEQKTSVVPFAAIVAGRTRLDVGGLWWRALVALVAVAAMLAIHEWLIGVSPFPYGIG